MTWKVKHEILLEAIAIGVMVVAILFLLAPNSRSVESENESKIVRVEGKKQRQSHRIQKVQKSSFTESEMTEFSSIESDITNKVVRILIDNDLDTLELFLEYLREKDDWRKIKSVADALFSVPDWGKKVTEDAQDYVLDAVSEYTPKTLPELLGFLESPHEDIRDDALDELASTIEESEDDAAMGRLIVKLSQTIEDEDFAERMTEHIDMMEDVDVAAKTIENIYLKGNAVFKRALSDTFEEIFETGEKVHENISKWLKEQKMEDDED